MHSLSISPVEEQKALFVLLSDSAEFRTFYENERHKIPWTVVWSHDNSLPSHIMARANLGHDQAGEPRVIMQLRTIPVTASDAFIVAHELEHVLLWLEGFPWIKGPDSIAKIANVLNNMLVDPVVNTRIASYGIDIRTATEAKIDQSIRDLTTFRLKSRSDELYLTLLDVSLSLLYQVVLKTNQPSAFHKSLHAVSPSSTKKSDKILVSLHKNGYDTAAKQTTWFTLFLHDYGLRKQGIVVTPPR